MSLVESGKVGFFAIEKPRLRQGAREITIEGPSSVTEKDKAGKEERRAVHAQRIWVQKDGKWLLGAQSVTTVEGDEEEREKRSEKK